MTGPRGVTGRQGEWGTRQGKGKKKRHLSLPTPKNQPRPTFKTKEVGKEKEIETKGNKFETFLQTLLAAQV